MKNKLYLLIFLALMSFVVAPVVLMLMGYSSFDSAIEKRQRAIFPKFSDNSLKSFVGELEQYFNDSFGLRQEFISVNAVIRNNLFKTSSSPKVVAGHDGWYFYKMNYNIDIYRGSYPLISVDNLDAIKNQQGYLEAYLKSKGIPLYFVFTPSKVSIYPEFLPDKGVEKQSKTVMDHIEDYLVKNSSLKIINTKPEVLAAKKYHQVFHKTDTHWNFQGAFAGYTSVTKRLKKDGIMTTSYFDTAGDLPTGITEYEGEFSNMMGDSLLFAKEKDIIPNFNQSSLQYKNEGDEYNRFAELFSAHGGKTPIQHISNQEALHNKKVLIFHDSFYGGFNALQLYAKDFSNVYSVWSTTVYKDIINYIKPDLVIYEKTERFLYMFGDNQDEVLIKQITKESRNPNYEVVSIKKLANMKTLQVEVENTGDDPWSEFQRIRLVLLHGGMDTGVRGKLRDDKIVAPNDIAIFEIPLAPEAGDYEIQMVQEGYMYFGPKSKI